MPTQQRMRDIQRRRQLAEMLIQQSQPQLIDSGRFLVGPNPLSAVTSLAGILGGQYALSRADRDEADFRASESARLAKALERIAMPTGGMDESGALPRDNGEAQPSIMGFPSPPRQSPAPMNPQRAAALEILRGMPIEQQQKILAEQASATLFPKLERQDVGNEILVLDQRGNVVRRMPKGVSPDTAYREEGSMIRHSTPSGNALLGAETQRRGQDISAQVQMRGQDVTMRGQDITAETARRAQDISLSKQEREQQERARAQQLKQKTNELAIDRALAVVDDALGLAGWRTTGMIGALTRDLLPGEGAGTDAKALAKTVETIQANLGFRELERMKAESATGASGLGQLTEREFDRLASTVANLDPNQDAQTIIKNLSTVREHLVNLRMLNRAALALDPSLGGGQDTSTGDAEIDALMDAYLGGGGR